MKMKKRTNSVISTLYHPIGNSRFKTAACMFAGGVILVCLGVGLIVTTFSVRRRSSRAAHSHMDETSVLISGPTCLFLGVAVAIFSGVDLCRYKRARNSVESELSRGLMGYIGKAPPGQQPPENHQAIPNPKISIVINKSLWPS